MPNFLSKSISAFKGVSTIRDLERELSRGLELYWSSAARILDGSGVTHSDPPEGYTSFEKNFFTALFLYSYWRAGVDAERRVLYTAVNQCLRGMVTGCDNILDDEYKLTLDTDLPESGVRFRSIIDIMASDRVLFELLLGAVERGEITFETASRASGETLRTLTRSGAQEATEEDGVDEILGPEAVLSTVHHYKTGILFQAPWAVPSVLEEGCADHADIAGALYRIGMGCQLMDDMVDFASDLEKSRHNYMVSLVHHGPDDAERKMLEEVMRQGRAAGAAPFSDFPSALEGAADTCLDYLRSGLDTLLAPEHSGLADPAILFLAERIGAREYLAQEA